MKRILLPLLALLGGGAGFALRRWQMMTAYDPATELFLPGAASTTALLLLLAGIALMMLVLIQNGDGPTDFLPAFRAPTTLHMTVLTAAAFLFFGAGVLGLLEGMEQLALWRASSGSYVLTYPAALLLCSVLCFPAGFSCLLLGKGTYREELASPASLLACFPPLAGLAWLFATHLDHGTDPVLMRYGFLLAAAALLTLAQFHVAGFFFGRCYVRRTLFFSLTGISFGLTALADLPSYFVLALTAAFLLSSLAWSCALLHNAFVPNWPTETGNGNDEPEEGPQITE